VIFLQHGLLDSANTWIINGPSESFAFILADAGYEVWLGNSRGNTYSQGHVSGLNSSQVEFWEFSWDQMASYDTPAKINYILSYAQVENITYVGHSEGTMMAFAYFGGPSGRELASKIDIFVGLAPVAYLGHVKTEILIALAKIPDPLDYLILGRKSFMEANTTLDKENPVFCSIEAGDCADIICLLAGCQSPSNYNDTNMPVLMSHFPAGTSVQNMVHYSQSVDSDLFQMYNYGKVKNIKIYHQENPPQYTVEDWNLPSLIFYGGRDKLADETDVLHLLSQLPVQPIYSQLLPTYGHGDFVWGMDARTMLYDPILSMLLAYHN
jgi:pimeloyl-ACP methyl ester carboxylesterase